MVIHRNRGHWRGSSRKNLYDFANLPLRDDINREEGRVSEIARSGIAELNNRLIEAVKSNRVKEVEELLRQGADPNIVLEIEENGSKYIVPIMLYAKVNYFEEIVKIFEKEGVTINLTDKNTNQFIVYLLRKALENNDSKAILTLEDLITVSIVEQKLKERFNFYSYFKVIYINNGLRFLTDDDYDKIKKSKDAYSTLSKIVVKKLIESGVDPNIEIAIRDYSNSPIVHYYSTQLIMYLIELSIREPIKLLLDAGANIFNGYSETNNPIQRCFLLRDVQTLELLVSHPRVELSLNIINFMFKYIFVKGHYYSRKALRRAAEWLVEYHLRNGGDPNKILTEKDIKNLYNVSMPIIILAAFFDSLKAVKQLVEAGADIHVKDNIGRTLLHHAVSNNDVEMYKYLVEQGLSPEVTLENARLANKRYGSLPLILFAAQHRATAIIHHMIQQGASIDVKDGNGWGLLEWALCNDLVDVVRKYYLDQGTSANSMIEYEDQNGVIVRDPLIVFAARYNAINTIKLLLERGAKLDVRNSNDESVLDIALAQKNASLLCLLVENGLDPNTFVYDEIEYCCRAPKKVKMPLLSYATRKEWVDVVKVLLEKGADVKAQDELKHTALYYAISFSYESSREITRLLLEKGADPNEIDYEEWVDEDEQVRITKTPLILYCTDIEKLRLLIEHGADVNASNDLGKTLLHKAVNKGDEELVKFLVNVPGIQVNKIDNKGRTPLDLLDIASEQLKNTDEEVIFYWAPRYARIRDLLLN